MAAPGYSVVMLLVSFSLLCRGTDAIVSRHPSFRRQRGRIHEGHTIDSLLLRHKRQGTGPSCKFSCIGYADGNYQSCLDCNVYVSCNDGVLVDNRPCNPGLVWNDNAVRCMATSNTCTACTDDIIDHASTYIFQMKLVDGSFDRKSCLELCLKDLTCKAAVIHGNACFYDDENIMDLQSATGFTTMVIRIRCPVHYRCEHKLCLNGATCVDVFGGGIICTCSASHFGKYCQEEFTCANGACLNGATCVDIFGNTVATSTTRCTCPSTYTGRRCGLQRCSENPCKSGSTCENVGTSKIRCICPAGKTGKYCDGNVKCTDNPCQNEGICGDIPNGVSCACTTLYTGWDCQTRIYRCAEFPCKLGSTCKDIGSVDVQCTCVEGYTGKFCKKPATCPYAPCQHAGTCIDNPVAGGKITCKCKRGYAGDYCERKVTCADRPCENEANCLSLVGDKTICDCPEQYGGRYCERDVKCVDSPCKNGGSCSDIVGGVTCQCTLGYKGARCKSYARCPDQPCQHNRLCLDGNAGRPVVCFCESEYTGKYCETVLETTTTTTTTTELTTTIDPNSSSNQNVVNETISTKKMAAGVVAVGAFAAGATAVVMYMTAVTGGAVGAAGAVGVAAATGQAATGTGAALVHATDVASAFVSSMLTSHKKSDDEEEGH